MPVSGIQSSWFLKYVELVVCGERGAYCIEGVPILAVCPRPTAVVGERVLKFACIRP
jgi:hypothetical protein